MHREDIHILRLMGEIERDGSPSQRELSRRLNLSVGLINRFIKRLVNKGYFKVKTMPRNRLKYFLTPEGLARKSRLTLDYLEYSLSFYREIKNLLINKFREMEKNNIRSILLFGAGEVADLAYLYMQFSNVRLVGIIDTDRNGHDFFEFKVEDFARLNRTDWDAVLLTRVDDIDIYIRWLVERGVSPDRIATL
jgi:DNA-binding MarR family transcriptional regulator